MSSTVFDPMNQTILADGQRVQLTPKAFAVLEQLRARAGQLVTKDTLLNSVWPHVCVGDAVLKNTIREIRRALQDDPRQPRFIETVHRRGYRLINELPTIEVVATADSSAPQPEADSTPAVHEWALAELQRNWQSAQEGQRQFVLLSGEPGVGKAALVAQLLQAVGNQQDTLCVKGQCIQQQSGSGAFLPIYDVVAQLSRCYPRDQLVVLMNRHAPNWLLQMPWLCDRSHDSRAVSSAGVDLLAEMSALLEVLSQSRPLLLVIEDLHYSDQATLKLLAYLVRRIEPARLCLVATVCSWSVPAVHRSLNHLLQDQSFSHQCSSVPLEFLNEHDVVAYLRRRCPTTGVPHAVAKALYKYTEGHPLLLTCAVEGLLADGTLSREGENWSLQALPEPSSLPDKVRHALDARRESLDDLQKRVLEAASLINKPFSAAVIATLLEQNLVAVEEVCEELVRSGQWLQPVDALEAREDPFVTHYRFTRTLYKRYFFNTLSMASRQRLQQRLSWYQDHAHNVQVIPVVPDSVNFFKRRANTDLTNTFRHPSTAAKYRAAS
ncbi:MAG: AAA family ATPase [Candidatus Competibacteraceae bacterium]|jgi:DNA-binding winged helix-turn-helix (wHTH) protein|nr:AAA family ATPase [Candidatus Competibacteraceae bacterium]